MPRRTPEGQGKFELESEWKDTPERKKAKDTIETNAAIGQAEDRMQKTVYSMLTPEERIEHDNLPTATEKREYIVKKYSKIFPPEEIK